MRFYLLLTAIMAIGLLAGVLTGKAVSGSTQVPQDSASLPAMRDLGLPGTLSPQVDREASSSVTSTQVNREALTNFPARVIEGGSSAIHEAPEKSGAFASTEPDFQVREFAIPREGLQSIAGRQVTSTQVSPKAESLGLSVFSSSAGSLEQAVQASWQVPSSVEVILVPLGDVNLNGVVEIDDLLLMSRFIGEEIPDIFIVVDWNGDGFVNVLDLATVAAHQGAQIP